MIKQLPSLNALKAFEAAARYRNFTRAAEQLHVTQSAISRQVKLLEGQLGVTLFERRPQHLVLTRAGQALMPVLRQSFDRIALVVSALHEPLPFNRLRVNVPPTFASRWLIPRLHRFRDLHPGIDISVTTALNDTLSRDAQLDCAIRFGSGEWPALHATLLVQERHIAVCAPRLLPPSRVRPDDLNHYTLLHVSHSDGRFLSWEHWLDAAGIRGIDTERGLEFDLLDLAIGAAVNGVGVTIADEHMIHDELSSRRLVPLLDVTVPGHQSYWFVTHQQMPEPPHVELFREWVQQEMESGQA